MQRFKNSLRRALVVGTPVVTLALVASLTVIAGGAAGTAQAVAAGCTATPGCGTPTPTQPTPSSSDSPIPGVTIGADGWISYASDSSALGVTGAAVTTVDGTLEADGSCSFDEDSGAGAASTPIYQEEVGFNPATCEDRILTGSISPVAEASIASPADTNTVAETPQQGTGDGASSSTVTPQAPPYGDTGFTQPDANTTPYTSAHMKAAWIDPVNITITSLTTNLRWPLYGYGGTLTARNNAYKFKYDGWSTSGTPTPYFQTVTNGWGTSGAETFKNKDFEYYVLGVFGPSGLAACGFTMDTAVFLHSVHIYGYRNGNYGYSWQSHKSGACSKLVHARNTFGYGWTS